MKSTCSKPFDTEVYQINLDSHMTEIDGSLNRSRTEKGKAFWSEMKSRQPYVELHAAALACEQSTKVYHTSIIQLGYDGIFRKDSDIDYSSWRYNFFETCNRIVMDRRAGRFGNIRRPISEAIQGEQNPDIESLRKSTLLAISKQPRKVRFEQRFCQ